MSSLLARAVDRLPAPIIWPIIVTLIVAGAIAIPIGLLLWSDAASMTVPSISEYSGTVASVSTDPKFGTHVTIRAENGPSPDIFFDGVVLDVGVGDRATVWAENQVGSEWGLKFESDRETWIDPSYGDLTKPVPPRGLFSTLALGGGVALVIVGLAGAYRRMAKAPAARPLSVSAGPPTDVGRAGLKPASISGAEAASAPTPPSPTAVGRAGTIAQIAPALGGVMWVAALMVRATGCYGFFIAGPVWLVTPVPFVVGAVFARSAASKARRAPGGDGRNWPAIATLAIALAAAGVAWIPVALFYYVFSCLG